ncbi:apses transcription factor-like protein [Boeremia exigua]|uniref:apses transcription factor-like protein n=1 Tax=Boeremia exigua TaxID=749465 RepID=UPI001E8D62D8|nr:apses transcription factor-like protein [Boeremia exigua]KAH6613969.1 apses transcription factor-like protein [Boeremia exigua]
MSTTRQFPERMNPLLEPTDSTAIEILIERRRLGQTNLGTKTGVTGVTSATKPQNSGLFDYAHLRVPLPKDLSGSEIFMPGSNGYPVSYFLMRRSSDGYISATGMFKAAFPWATLAEEEAERKYQKTFPSAGPDEVAGSVWIAPEESLSLADEYSMRHWVLALLDNEPIEKGAKDKHNVHIQAPPKFDLSKAQNVKLPPHTASLRTTRARSTRSVSPSKMATPSRKLATPRKSRATRGRSEAMKAEEIFQSIATESPSSALVSNGVKPSESLVAASGDVQDAQDSGVKSETVRIEVKETVEQKGDSEVTTTNVQIDVPATFPELREPEDPTKMIEEAKRMVEEARELDAGASSTLTSSKRKVEDVLDPEELEAERPAKLTKKLYTTEQKLTKEKVTRRALVGLTVMAALGTAIQYFAV